MTAKKHSGNLIAKAGMLTAVSLLVKAMGMVFRSYLSSRLGAEGLGLHQVVLSVYMLFSTVATSGFTVAVSRLTAEKRASVTGDGGKYRARLTLNASVIIALALGLIATVSLYFFASPIAYDVLNDVRAAVPLKYLSFSMIFMAVSACVKGYMLGTNQVYKPSVTSLFEQTVKIVVVLYILSVYCADTVDISRLCSGVAVGLTAGEAASFVLLMFMIAFFDKNKVKYISPSVKALSIAMEKKSNEKRLIPANISAIVMAVAPIAGSAYVTSALHALESVLIPAQLENFGGNRSSALAEFGIIRGMAIPAVFFPFAFLGSLVSIAIPEISAFNASGDIMKRNNKIESIMKTVSVFSIGAAALFFIFAEDVCLTLYKTTEATSAIKIMALITPFMYMETVSDGLLKSIGEEKQTFMFSIYNSMLRIIVILTLIPMTGVEGYLMLLVISNVFAFMLSYFRLKKKTLIKLKPFNTVVIPTAAAVAVGTGIKIVASRIAVGTLYVKAGLIFGMFTLLYAFFVSVAGRKKSK